MTTENTNNLAFRAGDHSVLLHTAHDARPNLNQGKDIHGVSQSA